MTPPIIGITTYGRNDEGDYTLPAEYVDAVRRAGGVPLLIPPGEPHMEAMLAVMDGLILSGGGDLDPVHYDSAGHPTIYMVDAERDAFELALARYAAGEPMPALCICRGLQVLNVALGGSLVEHLPDEVNGSIGHRQEPPGPTRHPVSVVPGRQLAALLEAPELEAVSWHHQAIRRLADPLAVAAQAADGVIEAVELPDHPWLIGVQWHPEMSAADDPQQQRIFDALVAAAAERKRARSG